MPSLAKAVSLRSFRDPCRVSRLQNVLQEEVRAIAGLSWWRFYFRFFAGAIKSERIVESLTALLKQIRKPLLIIWDGVGPHKSRLVKRWLDEQHGRIAIAFLPPYART